MARFRLALLILIGCSLSGCSYFRAVACPPLITYSDEFQAKAQSQLKKVRPEAPEVGVLVDDYGKTRNAIRKCGG